MTNAKSFQESLQATQNFLEGSVTKAEVALKKTRATAEELLSVLDGIRSRNVPFPVSKLEPSYFNDGAPTLTFQGLSRSNVLQLFELFPGVAVVMVSSGSTSFIPHETYKEEPRTTVTPIAPLVYRLSTWVGDLREEYYWWTKIADKLVKICVTNDAVAQCVAKVKAVHTTLSKEMAQGHFNYSDLPGGTTLQWYSSGSATPPLSVHFEDVANWPEQFFATKAFSCSTSYDPCSC